jgi:hypothetical protein
MIYELRTYDLRPNSVPEVEARFAAAYENRKAISEMAASFHTEIGPLNQVVQIWPYDDFAARERLTDEASKSLGWPPDIDAFVISESVEVFVPLDFSPLLKAGKPGPFFEMRTYEYGDGDLPNISRAWEAALPERLKWSPLAVLCSSAERGVNKLLHIWPFKTLDERTQVRAGVRATGLWPPHLVAKKLGLPGYKFLHQQNKILVPSSFSPLQ